MRRTMKRAVAAGLAAGGIVALRPGTKAHRLTRRGIDVVDRRLRYAGGRLTGVAYRLRGGHPATGADDSVVADRVRSTLGSVTKTLDVPHVHVTVENGIVLLHGTVDRASDAVAIETAALEVYGVIGVESYLHVGLTAGDTRPSMGRAQMSPLLHRLLEMTQHAGIDAERAPVLVRAALAAFADRLPEGERRHVAAHLAPDVAALFTPPRRSGRHPARTLATFADRVASVAGQASRDDAIAALVAVLRVVRAEVPDEAADVYAVLPAELHPLWPRPEVSHL